MSYPFKHIDRDTEKFKVTFLSMVTLQIYYDGAKGDYDMFRKFIFKYTGLQLSKERYDMMEMSSLRLKASNGGLTMKFTKGFIEFSINGNIYVSFENHFGNFIRELETYLADINSNADSISIEKINLWSIDKNSLHQAKDAIFSKDLQEMIPLSGHSLVAKEFIDDDNLRNIDNSKMLVKYGSFCEGENVNLILDTICSSCQLVIPNNLYSVAANLNQKLFDAYNWCVTDSVIDAMRKEPL